MGYPVTLNGRTYTLADFEGQNYVDGLPDAFEDFVTHAGNLYSTTSTTSNSIGTGSKTFTVESSKPYQVGTPLRITDSAAPSTNWMDGIVTAYSGTTLTVDVVSYAGSGTKTSWNINIGGGAVSYTGTLPVAQGGTGGTTAAAARTNLDVYSKADADSRFLNVSGEASDVTMTGDVVIRGAVSADIYHGLEIYNTEGGLNNTQAKIWLGANDYSSSGGTGRGLLVVAGRDGGGDSTAKFYAVDQSEHSDYNVMEIRSDDGVTFNEDGAGTVDFVIESSNYSSFFKVDSSTDQVRIGDDSSDDATLVVGAAADSLVMRVGGFLGSAGNGIDKVIRMQGRTAGGGNRYMDIKLDADNEKFALMMPASSSPTVEGVSIYNGTDGVVINESSTARDFRVESNNGTHMLFVDTGSDAVMIGTNTQAGGRGLTVGDTTGNGGISLARTNTYNQDWSLNITHAGTGSYGTLYIAPGSNTLSTAGVRILDGDSNNRLAVYGGGTTVVNDDSIDSDFRVESNDDANMFVVNAGDNYVQVGSTNSTRFITGWVDKRTDSVSINASETRWYKLQNYNTSYMFRGRIALYSARFSGSHQTNGWRFYEGSIAGYNGNVYGNFTSVGNGGYSSYTVEVGNDDNLYLKVPTSIYAGTLYINFDGKFQNYVFDSSTYVTSQP